MKGPRGDYREVPYMCLPGTIAEPSIAKSCLSCYDYVNGLADLVVGYLAAPLEPASPMTRQPQMVTIRNGRGARLWAAAEAAGRVAVDAEPPASAGDRRKTVRATTDADAFVRALDGVPAREQGAPPLVGKALAWALARAAPTGLEFARYSIDYHFLRNDRVTRAAVGDAVADRQTPAFAKAVVDSYAEPGVGSEPGGFEWPRPWKRPGGS